MKNLFQKFIYFAYRIKATCTYKNLHTLNNRMPLISFSFDDFPESAAFTGAKILKKYNAKGTFYVSFGRVGQESPVGKICDMDTIKNLIEEKHEIGSHTYNHANAYEDPIEIYESSILQNERSYKNHFLTNGFKTFSYPFGYVSTEAKRITEKYFRCSRTSYRGINTGSIDLNMLKAYPIYGTGKDLNKMKSVINLAVKKKGWLIFYTHDVVENPSLFGCTPDYFESVVNYAFNSGANITTVKEACNIILGSN